MKTVIDLITELKKLPQSAEVWIAVGEDIRPIGSVEVDLDGDVVISNG